MSQDNEGLCMLGRFSCVQLCVTPWTAARQAPLSMAFSRQEHCSGLPFPSPGHLPDPGLEIPFLVSPISPGGFFSAEPPGKPPAGSMVLLKFHAHPEPQNRTYMEIGSLQT